jgi:AcrR family transcriptional regulator
MLWRHGVARHQRADETYQRVLQSSAGLFAERGYLGTSVNDLVERAGLTKNAFYSYFPNKEALALAIVEHTAAQWPPLIASFEAMRAPAVDTVIALSFEVAERFANDVVVRAGVRLSLERESIKTPIPPPFDGWVDEIERLLSPASESELMGLAAPADVAARVIVTCLIGTQYLAEGPDLAKRLAEVWTVILPGLRPTPDPAARIATGQALRDRTRTAAVNTAPTTMVRMVDLNDLRG